MARGKVVNIKAAKEEKKRLEKEKALSKKQKNKAKKDKSKLSSRERERELRRRLVTVAIVIVLLVTAGYSVYKIAVLHVEKHKVETEHIDLKREKNLLEEELKNVQDLEYVEEEAREKLNLIMPGEVIYKFDTREQTEKNDK